MVRATRDAPCLTIVLPLEDLPRLQVAAMNEADYMRLIAWLRSSKSWRELDGLVDDALLRAAA